MCQQDRGDTPVGVPSTVQDLRHNVVPGVPLPVDVPVPVFRATLRHSKNSGVTDGTADRPAVSEAPSRVTLGAWDNDE